MFDTQNALGKSTHFVEDLPLCVLRPVAAENRLCRDCIGQMMAKDVTAATAVSRGLPSTATPAAPAPARPQPPCWSGLGPEV